MASLIDTDDAECERCKLLKGTWKLHECPYQAEINSNFNESCNCCSDCSHECAMDI